MRQQAAVLIADARNIPLLLREAKQGRHASIRVGLVDSLSRALTLLLSAYLKPHAHEISIRSGLTAMHAGELLTRKLDLFLGVDDLEETSGLERWEICREPYVLLLSPGSRPITTVENFKRFAEVNPFIRFSARSQTGADVERHLRLLGVNPTRSFEYDSPSAVAAMVSAGQGFAISTPLCLSESQYFEQVTTCPLPGPIFLRKLSVVARMGELGGIPREVADVARNALGKMVGAFNG
jgi:DNA-binding transcriptional LysR family regulator